MNSSAQGKRKNAVLAALFLFALFSILALIFFLSGSNSREPAPEQFLTGDPAGAFTLLALEESRNGVLAVLSGESSTLLLRLEPSTGQILEHRVLSEAVGWAGLRGETLFLRTRETPVPELISLDLETLSEASRRSLPWRLDDLILFDCDTANAYCTLSKSRNTLEISGAAGSFSREFPSELEFLEAGSSGLYLYGGGSLFQSQNGIWKETAFDRIPLKLLGNSLVLCRDGTVFRLERTGPAPLFQWENSLYAGLFYCLDGENCLILSNGSGVFRYSEAGELLDSCAVDSLLGICPAGGITRHNGKLFYVPLSFADKASSPSPEPSLSPSPTPSESPSSRPEEPPVKIDGSFLVFPAGTTVPQLRDLFKPDTADIRDAAGRKLTGGRLATGMTVNDWSIVVQGDCNGSGTVTTADLRLALAMVLEREEPLTARGRAADLNEDGILDTTDLLLLSSLAAS